MSAKIMITLALVALGTAMPHGAADTPDLEDIVADFLPQLKIDPAADPTEMMKQLTLSMLPLVRQVMELQGQNSDSTKKHLDTADQLVPTIMNFIAPMLGSIQSRTLTPRTTDFHRVNSAADHTERMKQLTLSMMPLVRQVTELQGQNSYNTKKHLDTADQLVPTIMDSIAQMFRSIQSRTLAQRTTNLQNKDLAEIVADNLPQLDPAADHTERMKQLTLSMLPIVRQVTELQGQDSYNTKKHLDTADQLVPTIMDFMAQMFRSSQQLSQ